MKLISKWVELGALGLLGSALAMGDAALAQPLPDAQAPAQGEHYPPRVRSQPLRILDEAALPPLDPPAMPASPVPPQPVELELAERIFIAPESETVGPLRGRFASGEQYGIALALIETRQAQKAYQQLAQLEERYSGDADFDYLYGLAALESGRASEAVFSLQRAANADTRSAAARMEFARALYESGDDAEARREFLTLLKSKPPREAEIAIRRYLSAIEERAERFEPRLKGSVELEAGYDNNANSGTRVDQFLNVPLDAESRASGSPYAGAALAGVYSRPLTPRLRWRTSLRLGHREYPDADFVSSTAVLGGSELGYTVERQSFTAGLQLGAQYLRDDLNQVFYALALRSARPVGIEGVLSAGVRLGQTEYGKSFADAQVQQLAADVAYLWRPSGTGLQADIGVFAGADDGDEVAVFSRGFLGAQAGVVSGQLGVPVRAVVGFLSSDYERIVAFPDRREDKQVSIRLSAEIAGLLGRWILAPQLSFIDNRSSLGIYDYTRVDAGISITRGVP